MVAAIDDEWLPRDPSFVFNWLDASGHGDHGQALVERLVKPGAPDVKRTDWLLLAAWCRDRHLQSLAQQCEQQAAVAPLSQFRLGP